ncbi:MAG: hypothetical protein MJZ17_05600 [Bacteroidales bacterium]|nr:hypothetical protein [Bacteroidales bacterium]
MHISLDESTAKILLTLVDSTADGLVQSRLAKEYDRPTMDMYTATRYVAAKLKPLTDGSYNIPYINRGYLKADGWPVDAINDISDTISERCVKDYENSDNNAYIYRHLYSGCLGVAHTPVTDDWKTDPAVIARVKGMMEHCMYYSEIGDTAGNLVVSSLNGFPDTIVCNIALAAARKYGMAPDKAAKGVSVGYDDIDVGDSVQASQLTGLRCNSFIVSMCGISKDMGVGPAEEGEYEYRFMLEMVGAEAVLEKGGDTLGRDVLYRRAILNDMVSYLNNMGGRCSDSVLNVCSGLLDKLSCDDGRDTEYIAAAIDKIRNNN